MDSLLTRLDTQKFYPPFLSAVKALLAEAANEGIFYWGISGYRPYDEQTKLYEQGRTTPGPIVTNARAGESVHQFGIGIDVCVDGSAKRGLQPSWKPEDYELLRTLAPRHGLVWGGTWKARDLSHLQLPNYITATHMEPLRVAYELGGLPSVFAYLLKGESNGIHS